MKIAVIGSRSFLDEALLESELNKIQSKVSLIITGGAIGADQMAENWARQRNISVKILKPDWAKFGRSAGIARNREIIEMCDSCYAFWDKKSKGTLSGINYCKKLNKPIKIINF